MTKDSGFTRETFVDALRAIHRLGLADWTEDGIPAEHASRLHVLFDDWRTRLTRSENP